jgi:hypothetical protein
MPWKPAEVPDAWRPVEVPDVEAVGAVCDAEDGGSSLMNFPAVLRTPSEIIQA